MRDNHLVRCFYFLFIISFLFSSCTDGKGFGGSRGGGFKGGSSKGGGVFSGSSGYNRGNNYGGNNMNKPRTGSSFKSNAMSFGAGALGGLAAYSIMRSMSGSYHGGPGYYEAGYGGGETCVNNEDMNGTKFGEFRCPLNGFPYEAKYCCGEYGKQYCCTREGTSRNPRSSSHFGWILLVILIILILIFLWARNRRQSQKDIVMVPMEPPANEQQGSPFYHPQPPPMGYPPPPENPYAMPPNGNPYAVPPQNQHGYFNPYPQQQYQMPYPPQQQPFTHNQVKEAGPPAYDVVMSNNQGIPSNKPY